MKELTQFAIEILMLLGVFVLFIMVSIVYFQRWFYSWKRRKGL